MDDPKIVVSIAGSDSSGGAGVEGDSKTICAHGLHPMTVVTAVTAQNSSGVQSITNLDAKAIASQLNAILDGFSIAAFKSGMLPTRECIETVAHVLEDRRSGQSYILDPVIRSTSGHQLIETTALDALVSRLFGMATLITPNIFEAELIANSKIEDIEDVFRAAQTLLRLGCQNVLVKGGHLRSDPGTDMFVSAQDPSQYTLIQGDFVHGRDVHGTGCMYASAIACGLAKNLDLLAAIRRAKTYVGQAIKHAVHVGEDFWLPNHFVLKS